MKYASAIKYGGELVSADECDHSSFKELIPLCPECKEAVFLRAKFTRRGKKVESTVHSHWSHFPGSNNALACELRVNSLSNSEREKIASKARGQRLKMIERWFTRVWESAIENDTTQIFCCWAPADTEDKNIAFHGIDKESFVTKFLEYALGLSVDQLNSIYTVGQDNFIINDLRHITKLDVLIVKEVIEFLATKRNRFRLTDLCSEFKYNLFGADRMMTGNNEDGDTPYDEWNDDPEYVAKNFVICLLSIDWSKEFLKLERSVQTLRHSQSLQSL